MSSWRVLILFLDFSLKVSQLWIIFKIKKCSQTHLFEQRACSPAIIAGCNSGANDKITFLNYLLFSKWTIACCYSVSQDMCRCMTVLKLNRSVSESLKLHCKISNCYRKRLFFFEKNSDFPCKNIYNLSEGFRRIFL